MAHVTLGGQQTIAAGSRKDDDKTSRNHHQHKRLIISKSVESADTVSKTLPVDENKIESAGENEITLEGPFSDAQSEHFLILLYTFQRKALRACKCVI